MRVTIPIHVKRVLQAQGWASGVRLVEEGAITSTLEGDPVQFEALYDEMNHLSVQLLKITSLLRVTLMQEAVRTQAEKAAKAMEGR